VDLDFAVLADGVVARPDGKLDILGAGYDSVVAPAVPAQHPRLVLALRVLIARHEAEHEHRLDVIIQAADGAELGRGHAPVPVLPPDARSQIPAGRRFGFGAVLTFDNIIFPSYGNYQIVVQWDGNDARSPLLLSVIEPPPAQP
jgi:hypothetical protein